MTDFGAKDNIAKSLNERGCEVTIYPAFTKSRGNSETSLVGIMLS